MHATDRHATTGVHGAAEVEAHALGGGRFLLSGPGDTDPATPALDAYHTRTSLRAGAAGQAREGWRFWATSGAFEAPGCRRLAVGNDGQAWEVTFPVVFD